ncbi:MAG: EutN/CcmL family microcompartment protein [Senegalia sp. (in: firmicutes)]|uniref:EutN/CcmL family microcompartment protein n=1 Tax=Senegalia sp. (in: firmicutes) TaxID=1924098 RepID=UPI003F9C3902
MIIGKVVGNVWATRKDEALNGYKLLVVKPLDEYSKKDLATLVATDIIGAGIGDKVLVVKGSSARRALDKEGVPIDATIVGIIDEVDIADD